MDHDTQRLVRQSQGLAHGRQVLCAVRLGLPADPGQCDIALQSVCDAQNWLAERGANRETLEFPRKMLACVRHGIRPSESDCAKAMVDILLHESLMRGFLETGAGNNINDMELSF